MHATINNSSMKDFSEDRYDKMKYRRCSKSGVLLPSISLGLWHNFGEIDSFENAEKMLCYAFDNGITHFDLANNYGPPNGSAESVFGKIFKKDLSKYRNELFISTKAGYDMWPGPYGNWGSRKYLMNSLDDSLRRMNLNYVDLFYSHRYDPNTPLEETMQTLVDMVKRGKALYVGISRYPKDAAAFAFKYLKERDVPCLIYQGRLNIFDREPEKEILDLCMNSGVGFIGFTPLAQGLLTDKYLNGIPKNSRMSRENSLKSSCLTDKVLSEIKGLNNIALNRNQSLAQMSISWILNHKQVTSVIVGASSVKQLSENIKALDNSEFSNEELKLIDNYI